MNESDVTKDTEAASETVSGDLSEKDSGVSTEPDALFEKTAETEVLPADEQALPQTETDTPASPLDNHEKEQEREKPARHIDNAFDFVELLTLTLTAVLLLTFFIFRHSVVDGDSMQSTLSNNDQLILWNLFYEPDVGDVIVFEDYATGHKKPLVKRVIATAGQQVTVYSDTEWEVDGVRYTGGYADGISNYRYPIQCTVREGHVFVMGDHRNNSSDSRYFGEVSTESVLGKVILRLYPFASFGIPGDIPEIQ